ncbi:MAG: hypothetical protein ACR2QO_22045 [Acidimicrobiales bacterium]
MAQNSASPSGNRNALIQWLALVVFAVLALLAAFVFFGGDNGGGHSGLPAPVPAASR